jgi:hypothetical protein
VVWWRRRDEDGMREEDGKSDGVSLPLLILSHGN